MPENNVRNRSGRNQLQRHRRISIGASTGWAAIDSWPRASSLHRKARRYRQETFGDDSIADLAPIRNLVSRDDLAVNR